MSHYKLEFTLRRTATILLHYFVLVWPCGNICLCNHCTVLKAGLENLIINFTAQNRDDNLLLCMALNQILI